MLEVGEDPNYFIKNPEHRKIKDLLNPQLWTNIGIGKQKGKLFYKKNDNKCVFSTQLQSQQINQYRSGYLSKVKSFLNMDKQRSLDDFQNILHQKKNYDQEFLQQRLEEKLQRATQNKMEYSIKQYSDVVLKNNKRFDEWKKRKNRELLIHEDYVNILQNKMAQKWHYLDNKKEQKEKQFKVQQNSKYNKDKIQENQLQKKIQKAQEDNEEHMSGLVSLKDQE
ncbi:hypothetical protein PPERSA_05770 [Pseudocohnilembus persalinus]|uniref:Uncharacterized protein n=1 Tax=Pseudocohnilembus persalinus TaxID=266149 RepID=A0A0V0QIF4_PSEPJ|nr:hypothetical protein PPERSA_05770 [Pseudocohnilembus persalinus]|eukprot:KRX01931.1 hypothetical protein PPERSA_05770 [Pseudocohnilembus persalinus]